MRTTTRFLTLAGAALVTVAGYSTHARAAYIKVADPTSVVTTLIPRSSIRR